MLGDSANIPSELRHTHVMATPLTLARAAADYAAYMSSPEVIRAHSDGRWPVDGFTPEEDRRQVAQHQADHEAGRAFTFSLLDPRGSRALGCLYLNPLRDYLLRVEAAPRTVEAFPTGSAMVTFWLRQDQQDGGLAEAVVEAVDDWLAHQWPMPTHLFRVLPAEASSVVALERVGLQRVHLPLPGEPRRYRWYRSRFTVPGTRPHG